MAYMQLYSFPSQTVLRYVLALYAVCDKTVTHYLVDGIIVYLVVDDVKDTSLVFMVISFIIIGVFISLSFIFDFLPSKRCVRYYDKLRRYVAAFLYVSAIALSVMDRLSPNGNWSLAAFPLCLLLIVLSPARSRALYNFVQAVMASSKVILVVVRMKFTILT